MAKTVKVPQKFFETNQDFQDFVENEREWMYNRIVESIEYSFRNGYDIAPILEAKIEDTMKVICMNSESEEWVKSLSLALKWNEEQENYEKCSSIFELIEEIKKELQC